ncbi:Hypothetical protein PHPALM_17614 [Phytophthora palmivora]|uniref:Uncharacterized protein n=1 Tax=Phytophthora palmivora TaxID=4796 RepID=A0A2P4XLT1_9STRA|nr:Hypothetical protein PHPALM_17614 [Phytophthora palmivora]
MHLYFNNRFMGFGFDHTQRCYTISHCWDDHSENAEWSGLPSPGEMAWFEDKYCAGESIAKSKSDGSIDFRGTKLHNKVSSFMVRQYGLYATDGIVDYCHENSTLSTADVGNFFADLDNTTNSGGQLE